jgi:hypothetical protein
VTQTVWANDPVVQPLIAMARTNPEIEGLILSGSRGAGVHDAESDYDLEWVLADEAYDQLAARGDEMRVPEDSDQPWLDIGYTCCQKLAEVAAAADWRLAGYTTAQVLYDKTGQVTQVLRAMGTMSDEQTHAAVLSWFDAYINAFYRSLKAWRRGNELGGRLQAAASVMYLVHVSSQGWQPGALRHTLLQLLQTGDPRLEQELELKIEALLRARGFEVNLWGGEIDRVKAFHFE